MTENNSEVKKGKFNGIVHGNERIGEKFYRLGFDVNGEGGSLLSGFKPGQFVQLQVSRAGIPPDKVIPSALSDVSQRDIILRRPFSFCNIEVRENSTLCEILYCVLGPSTLRMTTLSGGDTVSVIGPLGNGFWLPDGRKKVVLVAGGIGAAPLEFAGKYLTKNHSDIEVIVFAGAKTVNELPFEGKLDDISQNLGYSLAVFARYGIESKIATDDGSAGFKGTVLECFQQWYKQTDWETGEIVIYGCGPEAMLAKLSEIAGKEAIDCQVSMERRMACGIGVCQSCAVECKTPDSAKHENKLCCEDGPVFDSREVVFKI